MKMEIVEKIMHLIWILLLVERNPNVAWREFESEDIGL